MRQREGVILLRVADGEQRGEAGWASAAAAAAIAERVRAIYKAYALVRELNRFQGGSRLFVVPFGQAQQALASCGADRLLIGTLAISELPDQGGCTLLTPRCVETRARLDDLHRVEGRLDISELAEELARNAREYRQEKP